MFGFLRRLFGGGGKSHLSIDAFWCESPVKLPDKVKTPLGSSVTVVNVCVDIEYSIQEEEVVLRRVRMSPGGGQCGNMSVNVAGTRTGEAWYAAYICPESHLVEAVQKDLSADDSRLRKIMFGKWRSIHGAELAQSVADALNEQLPPAEIGALIASAGHGNEITFTYTMPNGNSETRHVSVQGVSGQSLRGRDHKDDQVKSFRIDRITNAKKA
jgi:hypothetical protein